VLARRTREGEADAHPPGTPSRVERTGVEGTGVRAARRGSKNRFPAKFGKETVAGAHWRPKWVPHYGAG